MLSALALIPLVGGCDLFSIETTIDDACVLLTNRTIDGAAAPKMTRSFSYDELGVFDGFIALDAQVTKLGASIAVASGPSDLSFLDSVHVSIAADGLAPLEIIACDDFACASDTKESSVEVVPPANLTDYALGGRVQITVTLEGDLPTTPWAADLKVCLSGSARLHAGF